MTNHAVLIAGAGPTGMTLAAELALAGVDVAVLERETTHEVVRARAGGLHARTLEVFDQRGLAERFLKEGKTHPALGFHQVPLALGDFPTRHNYLLALAQNDTERILAGWVEELGVEIQRGTGVTGLRQDAGGVEVELSDGRRLGAEYLVGCDGGRSVVRKAAGIEFPGWDPTTSWLSAEVELSEPPPLGFRQDAFGLHAMRRLENGHTVGVVLTEPRLSTGREPTLGELSETLVAIYGTDFGVHDPSWISRFTDATRQAARYRNGRVLLAGDAAHVHPPLGGQGLNLGVQDAMNLGWKLAQVVKGISPAALLDSYEAERHPVAARVLQNTMAQVALRRQDERTKALGRYVAEFLALDEPRKRLAAELSGLGLRYDLGEGHPLLGRRMPDLDLVVGGAETRLFRLLHEARPLLLRFGGPGGFDLAPWSDRVRWIDASCAGPWILPVVGAVAPPTAVLVRPDGYVAWVGEGGWDGLARALATWFGDRSA